MGFVGVMTDALGTLLVMTTTSSPDTDTSPESPYPGDHETPTPPRRRRWLWGLLIGGGVVFVALVAFVLIVFQPQRLFIDDKVDEALPGLVVAGEVPAAEAPAAEPPAAPAAPTIEESAPVVPPVPTDPFEAALVEAQRIGAPVAVTAGDFVSLDHATSGTAFLVVQPDGSRILRIEDLDTDNGPDLRVVLSTAEVGSGDYGNLIELGRLKGNIGSQNYEIPADLDLSTIRSTVIWCERFSSGFGEAPTVVV